MPATDARTGCARGRPARADGPTRQISIRLSPAEWEHIRRAAGFEKKSLAEYARMRFQQATGRTDIFLPMVVATPERAASTRVRAERRKARLLANFVERVERAVVYTRSKGRCGICGAPVRRAEFVVDHIVPLAKGGEHSYANSQAAHWSCNAKKGTRVDFNLRRPVR